MPEEPKGGGADDSIPENDQLAERRKKSPPVDQTILEVEAENRIAQMLESEKACSSNDPMDERRKKASEVDRTMLEAEVLRAAAEPPADQSAAKSDDSLSDRRKKASTVDKTNLDMDAVLDMATKTVSEKEGKIREELDARLAEPAKPIQPIEKFRAATPCQSSWDKMTGSGAVRFCEQCKSQVYDFSKVEMAEAEETIFKREGKKNFVLYKRKDGKFLAGDCPVGVRRVRTLVAVSVSAALLAVGCILLLVFAPQAPPGTKTVTVTPKDAAELKANQAKVVDTPSGGWQTITAPQGNSKNPTPNPNSSMPVMPGPSSANPAQNYEGHPSYLIEMAAPTNAPYTPGPTPFDAQSGQPMTAPPAATQTVPGQSAIPGTAPTVPSAVLPAQAPPTGTGTVPGSQPTQTFVPIGQDPGSITPSPAAAPANQPSQQTGVWQRPMK